MRYYLIHDPEYDEYTIWYKRTANSNFCYNEIENRWGSIEHVFSTFTPTPKLLAPTNLQSFDIVFEFTPQSHPEFFI